MQVAPHVPPKKFCWLTGTTPGAHMLSLLVRSTSTNSTVMPVSRAVDVAEAKDSFHDGVKVSCLVVVQERIPLIVKQTIGSGAPPKASQALPDWFWVATVPLVTVSFHKPDGLRVHAFDIHW